MSAFDDGVKVLQIAAGKGNRPSQAVLDELAFRQSRIDALHELNSELNGELSKTRLQVLELQERLAAHEERERLLRSVPHYKVVGTNGTAHLELDEEPDPMEHLTHAD